MGHKLTKARKGIILAGGSGTRLHPVTISVSKQLLPVYDKPLIYYPLSTLMMAGIKEILLIVTPRDIATYKALLGTGEQWGIKLNYAVQDKPNGIAEAFVIAEEFLDGAPICLILGDNIFYGHGLINMLRAANENILKATVFGYHVNDPERYGVAEFDSNKVIYNIIEKPSHPSSNYAVTGLYFVGNDAIKRAKSLCPSNRGELEVTDLLNSFIFEQKLELQILGRGYSWFDTGTADSLLDASNFVKTITNRQGLLVGSPDEVAIRLGWIEFEINDAEVKSKYYQYLSKLILP
jgi:glucose-1-phosphate thymidylyltransferase